MIKPIVVLKESQQFLCLKENILAVEISRTLLFILSFTLSIFFSLPKIVKEKLGTYFLNSEAIVKFRHYLGLTYIVEKCNTFF